MNPLTRAIKTTRLTSDGDGKVKISDFGLAREGTEFQMDPHNRVPIRWLAPETLRTAKYSQKTDVWAFGKFYLSLFP